MFSARTFNLHLPRDQEEIKFEFEAKFGMVQAFGAIDGAHIPIMAQSTNSQDYYNYKSFQSLNVQAVCDYCGLFLDVEWRWPGNVHDAKMFTILVLKEHYKILSCQKLTNVFCLA